MPKIDFDLHYMRQAFALSAASTCSRLRVGAILATADRRRQVGNGYNGSAAGQDNDCLRDENGQVIPGACGHLHAEDNCLLSCTYDGPMVMYVTTLPCRTCAIRMVNFSKARGPIKQVYIGLDYRNHESLDILTQADIKVTKMREDAAQKLYEESQSYALPDDPIERLHTRDTVWVPRYATWDVKR